MHIGIFTPYSLTFPGGVQNQVLGLGRALRRRGHDVRVLGPCDGPPPESGITPLGNSIFLAANGSVAPIAPDPSAVLRTIRALRDEDFDVVHLHEPLVPGPTMTALLYKQNPTIGTFHAAGESPSYRWLRPGVRWLGKRLDLRCAVSEAAAALASRALGGTYLPTFNGVEITRFSSVTPWPAPQGLRTVLFVGRHEPRKGLEVLLEAHRWMPDDVQLWVAGTGPQTEELRARYGAQRIEWLGRISDVELARRWRSASVYCAPSLGGESFGVVLLESMAAGAPVVASDIAGYRNVVTQDVDALLVAPDDPAALAAAVNRVLGDPALAVALIEAGAKRAESFSMDALAEDYELLYQSIVR